MSSRLIFLASALAVAAVAGCYTGSPTDTTRGPSTTTGNTDPANAQAGETVSLPGNVAAPSGLPCDVAQVIDQCSDCHGKTPSGGASVTIVSYDDLVAKSADDPTKTIAEVALARMKSASRPMPPTGQLPASTIATFEAWVTGGMQKASCGKNTPAPDGGTVVSVPTDPGPPPDPTALTCTSGKTAAGHPGPTMKPGVACGTCHQGGDDAPVGFAIAGTLYPTLHEPDNCVGVAGANILIIDANNETHTMTANDSGNFVRYTAIPLPYRAMVLSGGKVREMKTPQTNGDCNSCHTGTGGHAPGRVMTP